jgi:hypothetical protein
MGVQDKVLPVPLVIELRVDKNFRVDVRIMGFGKGVLAGQSDRHGFLLPRRILNKLAMFRL